MGTFGTTNRLVRECFQTRHLSTRINQLEVQDPSQVCFVAWSDAALANRIDLGSKLVECGCCHLLPKSLIDIVRRCLSYAMEMRQTGEKSSIVFVS